jgi:hypothetical protein
MKSLQVKHNAVLNIWIVILLVLTILFPKRLTYHAYKEYEYGGIKANLCTLYYKNPDIYFTFSTVRPVQLQKLSSKTCYKEFTNKTMIYEKKQANCIAFNCNYVTY